jgi:hypothetical protein
MNSKKVFNFLIFSYLVLVSIFFVLKVVYSGISPYPFGDILINYHYGFIRRGMIGTFFIEVSKLINCNLYTLVNYFMALIYLFVFSLLIIKSWNQKLLLILFVTSPFGLLFVLNDWSVFGYKDIVLVFIFIVVIKIENIENIFHRTLLQSSIIILGVLIHESFLFLSLPFVFLQKDFNNSFHTKKIQYLSNMYLWVLEYRYWVILIFILGVSIYLSNYFSNSILIHSLNEEFTRIYNNLAIKKFNSTLAYSPLDWLSKDISYVIQKTSINYLDPVFRKFTIFDLFILIFYVLTMFFNLSNFQVTLSIIKKYRYSLFSIILGYLFIFLIATDWGRWMHIFFMHFSVVLIMNKNKIINSGIKLFMNVSFFSVLSMIIAFSVMIPHVYYIKKEPSYSMLFNSFNFILQICLKNLNF